jgi:hypothetical protein
MKKEALAAIMATTLLVLSLLSPFAGAVGISYAADSGGNSVSITESYDQERTIEGTGEAGMEQTITGKTMEGANYAAEDDINSNGTIDAKISSLSISTAQEVEVGGNASAAQETEVDAEPGHADSTEATRDDEVDNATGATRDDGITDEQRKEAIVKGLRWLAEQQEKNMVDPASPTYGVVDDLGYPVALTAFAVLKFEHYAKYTRVPLIDPFDADYEYSDNIVAGWEYIFEQAVRQPINIEHGVDDPDVNLVNGHGVYFLSPNTNRPVYETGIVMMALTESCHPEKRVDAPGSPVNTWTYLDVMKDTTDYVAWAQNDDPNCCRGGWRYGAYDDGDLVPPGHGEPYSDTSTSQFPAMGLMAAEEWEVSAPDWVRDELCNYWLSHSQNYIGDGGFWYHHPNSWENVALTAAGMVQLTYCCEEKNGQHMMAARNYIASNWLSGGADPNIGNLYAMYGVMKASMLAKPVPPAPEVSIVYYGEHHWQNEYDRWIIDNQTEDGGRCWPGQYAVPGIHGRTNSKVLATELALLILEKVAPKERYEPKESFEDLLKSQAELLFSFENLLNRTWDELTPAEQLEFLESFEDLLKSQEKLIKSFEDLLNMGWDKLSREDQIKYLRSFEELLKSQEKLLFSFEDLLKRIEED